MGWKNIKEHFSIGHNVCITSKGICIGSGYVHDLAVIDINTGSAAANSVFKNFLRDKYPALLDATAEEVLQLISNQDTFKVSLPVYTYDGGEIVEKHCEEYGWPNVTHDGEQMYDNTFFTDKKKAIEAAMADAVAGVKAYAGQVEQYKTDLNKARVRLDNEKHNLKVLETAMAAYA